ncbi:cytidine 5'-phosphate N-acetylneuraminic acid synthetase [uncultured Desulfovibrio sp.]|uniref:cytidine 5'-phosphate N-acetylneuraminic acid synthetase n=1 Tax=uncultured Desulfovibrio sp. TaxID=167968 RepID=UPI0003A57242|nr:cytidine 5'-phosphate N-acetylneuraminic acid synthetase [uncultured Desulfovibrio sp.]
MKERCIVIPAVKKNAVIPDQLVKKLAGVTLMERAIHTARAVAPGEDIVALTDSQEISLICERAGVGFHWNRDLRFTSLDIVTEMRDLLGELARRYEHCVILRASCPLLTWVDVEDAWKKYLEAGADSLVTVKSVRQRIWNVRGDTLESLLDSAGGTDGGEEQFLVESRALIILRLALLRGGTGADADPALSTGHPPVRHPGRIIPYFLNERSIEIQSYQDWWICERLLLRRHVVFVVAGYPAIGMGHVFRALMLAHEITSHKITFVCTRESELAVENIASKEYRIVRQGGEELADAVLALRPDLVVNDFLNTGTAYMERLRAGGARCVNFEDEGPGAELAQLVVNALYESGQSTERLRCGPDYFCLRDEFVGAARNPLRSETRTVLITFGGTDQRDCSRRVLDIIEPICRAYGIAIRLVAGPGYAHKESMEAHLRALKNPLVSFTWATNVMSRMMEGADLAICSAGRTVYELAHMRVPGMVLAHHEREARHTFARPRNGFAFMGLMDRVGDVKIRNIFLSMLKQARRARFWERQNRLDFTANKARVVGLMLDLLDRDEA